MYDAFKTVVVLTDTTIGRLRYHNDGGGKTSLKIKSVCELTGSNIQVEKEKENFVILCLCSQQNKKLKQFYIVAVQ